MGLEIRLWDELWPLTVLLLVLLTNFQPYGEPCNLNLECEAIIWPVSLEICPWASDDKAPFSRSNLWSVPTSHLTHKLDYFDTPALNKIMVWKLNLSILDSNI